MHVLLNPIEQLARSLRRRHSRYPRKPVPGTSRITNEVLEVSKTRALELNVGFPVRRIFDKLETFKQTYRVGGAASQIVDAGIPTFIKCEKCCSRIRSIENVPNLFAGTVNRDGPAK